MRPKISIFTICLLVLLSLQGCDSSASDADIQTVRADYFDQQRTATIGDSFERTFDSPRWPKETSARGEVLVIFTGKISVLSDKTQACLDELATLYANNDEKGQYKFVESLVIMSDNPSSALQEIAALGNATVRKRQAIEDQLKRELEQAVSAIHAEKYAQIQAIDDKLAVLNQQERELKNQQRQIAGSGVAQQLAQIDRRIRETQRSINSIRASRQPNETRRAQNEALIAQYEAELARLNEQRDQLSAEHVQSGAEISAKLEELSQQGIALGQQRQAVFQSSEFSAREEQIQQEFRTRLTQELAAIEPFAQEQRDKINTLAVQAVKKLVPQRGAPIRITWRKHANPHIPNKFGYTIISIDVDGQQRTGFFLSFLLN